MRWVFFSGVVVARKVASLLADLGLDYCPNFFRDRQFLAALAAGVLFWLALAYIWPNPHADTMTLTALLSLCLFQPVMEELIFRGVIQTELLRKRWGQRNRAGFSTANWITSVAFAALHFVSHPPLWAAAVLAPSLLFGYFRERHRSLYPPLALHIYYNTGYFLTTGFST